MRGMVGLPSPSTVPSGQPAQKIALLLPLQGQYGASAQAIRNGFLAAYYDDKQQGKNVPNVVVLDTSMQDVRTVYQQAIAQGASIIVAETSICNTFRDYASSVDFVSVDS